VASTRTVRTWIALHRILATKLLFFDSLLAKTKQLGPHHPVDRTGLPHAYLRLVGDSGHEAALDLVSGVGFGCVLHHLLSPTRWSRSRGQVRPETCQSQKPNKTYMLPVLSEGKTVRRATTAPEAPQGMDDSGGLLVPMRVELSHRWALANFRAGDRPSGLTLFWPA
jgi:hypothetical protein